MLTSFRDTALRYRLGRLTARRQFWAAGICAFMTAIPCCAHADDAFSVRGALEDTKLYFTAPLRWDQEDWIAFGATLAAVGAAHEYDEKVRRDFATGSKAVLNGGADKNSLRDAAPTLALIAGTGVFAAFIRDSDGYRETWALVEAGILSGSTAEVLGLATGRQRPDATVSPNAWRQGGDSFPSLHVSTAFAIGTVFAESGNDEYRWLRRIIGYGVAGATGYVRINENVHWLSDTVAGAALGIATARFVLNRQNVATLSTLQFEPIKNGWRVSYSMRTH
jgi:membrane-associated phospholipid phosphatase